MICFVVLHYKNLEVTKMCLDSLINLPDITNHRIIVVDNGSNNGSGELIENDYHCFNFIDFLISNDNLGFAEGNNMGYSFAKNKYNPQAIIVMNNDVIINDPDFIIHIENCYKMENCAIVAPNVVNLNDFHQNPYMLHSMCLFRAVLELLLRQILLFVYSHSSLRELYFRVKSDRKLTNNQKEIGFLQECTYGIVPHGSIVVFLYPWVSRFDKAFFPGTFLYVEEEILYDLLKKYKMQAVYMPNINAVHLEDQSTNTVLSDNISKSIFILQNAIKSRKVMIKVKMMSKKRIGQIMKDGLQY